MGNGEWSRDEHLVALDLYLNHPDVLEDSNDPEVQAAANLIGRTPGSVAQRLANYRHLDPGGTKGLSNVSNRCKQMWREYAGNEESLSVEAERARKRLSQLEVNSGEGESGSVSTGQGSREQEYRIGQSNFRNEILDRYDDSCLVCDISDSGLLQAGHILDWSEFDEKRGDLDNGILLCYTHHKAFDAGYFTVTPDFHLRTNPEFNPDSSFLQETLIERDGEPLSFPGPEPNPDYARERNRRLPWYSNKDS